MLIESSTFKDSVLEIKYNPTKVTFDNNRIKRLSISNLSRIFVRDEANFPYYNFNCIENFMEIDSRNELVLSTHRIFRKKESNPIFMSLFAIQPSTSRIASSFISAQFVRRISSTSTFFPLTFAFLFFLLLSRFCTTEIVM